MKSPILRLFARAVAAWLLAAPGPFLDDCIAAEPQEESSAEKTEESPTEKLSREQAKLAARFQELQQQMLNLAELTRGKDRRRAGVLRHAVEQSKQREIQNRLLALAKTLEEQQLGLAKSGQEELKKELQQILELLLKEDRANRIESEKKKIEDLLKRVGRIIKEQRGIKARTEGGDNLQRLVEGQENIRDKTEELEKQLAEEQQGGAAPGEKQSPADGPRPKAKPGDGEGEKSPGGEKPGQGEKSPAQAGEGEKANPGEGEKPGSEEGEKQPGAEAEAEKGKPKSKPGESEKSPGEKPGEKGEPSEGEKAKPGEKSKPGSQQGEKQPSGKPQEGGEGESGESPPQEQPQDSRQRIRERIKLAEERMKQAKLKLEKAERKGASGEQQQALDNLQQAKAELEEILRQLREEEVERVLAALAERFQAMLAVQIEVYEGTLALASIAADKRGRDEEIEAGRLSRREAEIVREADKALTLLRADGSGVAFPEAVGQMRDDMEQVVVRLAQIKVDAVTQGIQEDIIQSLEEMIEALKQAQEDLEERKRQQQQGQPMQSGPMEESLLNILAELKLIRALQIRVNSRHRRYAELIKEDRAREPDLRKALERLSERQERIRRVTRDLHLGKNR